MERLFYPPQTNVLPLTTIRRERELPWQGEVLVNTGQQVEPSDVVARAGKPRPHLILNVTKQFQIPSDQAERCFLKDAGELVRQGETLAEHKTTFMGKRKIISPVDGRVAAIKVGRMVIEPRPELFELRALLSGVVAGVAPRLGVTIETPGALIQAVWGSGKEGYGVLKMGVSAPDAVLAGEQIEIGYHGAILVCGATLDMELLEKALEMQVRGLIVGGVPAELREQVIQQVLPVVATEGIGRVPISSVIFNLLQANKGREAMMLAVTPNRWQASRPEIIIPLPASDPPGLPPLPGTPLAAGLKVHIKRAPYRGAIGTVKQVVYEPRRSESGVKYPGAEVVLDDGTVVFVPHVNLDLIGG